MPEIIRKIKPTCGNCNFSYHKKDDLEELERCKLVGRFNQARINPEALDYVHRTDKSDCCEYHRPTERLKSLVDYTLS